MATESPKQIIQKKLLAAMKGGSDAEKRTLKMIKAEIINEETKAGAGELDDAGFQAMLKTMVKKRKQSITEFEKAGRDELAAGEKEELVVIEEFLPEAVSEAEIQKVVTDIMGGGDYTVKDMGKIIGQVMGKFKGQNIDGSIVSKVVKSSLG